MDLSTSPKRINRTKTTLWNLFHLYFGVIIGIARAFLIIPLYLQFISAELYGAWLATGNILMWLTLFDPGVGDVALQKVSEAFGKKDKTAIKYIISSSIFISFVICILVLVIGLSITDSLIKFVRIPPSIDHHHLKKAFNIGIITTAITLFLYSISNVIIGFQETKLLGWIRNGSSLLALGSNIILLFNGYQLLSISYAGLIGASFQAISYGILLFVLMKRERITFALNFRFLRNYSKIFSFTFLANIIATIAQNIDLILISRYISLENVTILEMTRRPLKVIRGLAIAPSVALLPSIAHLFGEQDYDKLKKVIDKSLRVFIFMFILIAAGFIAFNGSLITLWLGGKYYLGDFLNLILVLTFLFYNSSYVFFNFDFCIGWIKEISIFQMIKGVGSILFLVVGGYLWKLEGILFGSLLITLISEFWYYPYLLNKSIKFSTVQIKLFSKEILLSLIGSGIITFFFALIKPITWTGLSVAAIVFAILNITLFLGISRDLRKTAIHYAKGSVKWLQK